MSKKKGIITLVCVIAFLLAGTWTAVFGLDSAKTGSAANIKQGLDLAGGVSITYQVVGDEAPSSEDMADTIYKLQQRVDNYSTEAQVYQEGSDRINIEIPGVTDANAILEELGKPGSLTFLDKDGKEVLSGTDVADAQAAYQTNSMNNQEPVVSLTMTADGTKKFADATKAAYPNHDVIYIVYDNQVISAPSVQAEITDGKAVINGMSSFEEAENLASTIRIGGLKLELEELLLRFQDEGKEPSAIAQGMSRMKTGVKLAMDESDATVADLITDGCNMGVKSLSRYLNQYKAADERSKDLAKRLIHMEEQLAVDVRPYL